ncbi:putative membrane protein [Saccharomonospora amisosensis]|uniref:Putative membrane protein n=1 Tax=Saccharomonospora amisosensis TaxID=1128677 RepID=A0A7X5UNR2_9PSEU|nr:SHOCT domain-containing protein [Saccharomonospora amisosensis]NIJ11389.1 putative membrane protein [Saccharomonospora amisosensis]
MMGGWGMGWMWIWPTLVVLGLLALVAAAVLWSRGRPAPPRDSSRQEGSSARRILDERYARGEIDEEEYRRRRAQLE